ncbi:PREDICTED: transcription factor bHLH157 [Erythranthe guttata]|uniref:transcription factor bHLH157 n=1 Tax=Erythranthe guttata TaxID=4155 RepID=UPI00064D7A0F|nr:PREDICTED: transcription factor bHLH157 [Erythranthe guttata]|eukprot:XP_012842108.1 PREDICTED: transcription factor bHLH157 [Erythranthe guttata]
MSAEKCDSIIKEALKILCCSNGWCYGIFWGFHQTNSLLLTVKDTYYEEQMALLIDNLLLQVHVVGGGVIGQVAFAKNHQWIHSDAYNQSLNSLVSFESLEFLQDDDSEFNSQFSMGIKTIALISIEPWGVVQFGSTHKNPETKEFVSQVKRVFGGTDEIQETRLLPSEPSPLFDSRFLDSEMAFCSLPPFPSSTSDNLLTENPIEKFLLDSENFFDCSANQTLSNNSDCSVLTSSWPHFTTYGLETNDCNNNAQRPSSSSGLLSTLDDFFQESDFADVIPKHGLKNDDDPFQWFSPQPHANGLVPLSRNSSPVFIEENIPTNSMQSSVTDALRTNTDANKSAGPFEIGKLFNKPLGWNETLIPVDDLKFVGPKNRPSNSLFTKIGLDRILDGIASDNRYEDRSSYSSIAKRRKIDNGVKIEGVVHSFDGRMSSIEEVNCEGSRNSNSCTDAGPTSSSRKLDEQAKPSKKKAKAGSKPRPKDRQMIQDRLAELRELIPNGEKMSIDRLLERTIKHMNFMQSLQRHTVSLKQLDKTKAKQSNEVTWACEVGDQTMVCPLIVEDLTTPGQMLIEMLCEEQGFFLEIVDVIRGFGLIVLKGVMEVRETNKIWAHFMVEAEGNRLVTRHEIFSSLIQLLQMSGQTSATNTSSDGFSNVISSAMPSSNNYQPSFPVNFADAIQCANL